MILPAAAFGLLLLGGCKPESAPSSTAQQSASGLDEPVRRPAETHKVKSTVDDDRAEGDAPMPMSVNSSAFSPGGAIPARFTADGEDFSPPLSWSGVPSGAKELALIMDDPDAPRPQPWVHWVIYKLKPDLIGLPEGVAATERPPAPPGALQGKNSWGKIGYGGPSPPSGLHHYHFKLYALGTALDVKPGLTKDVLLKAMDGHIVAQAEVVGTYRR